MSFKKSGKAPIIGVVDAKKCAVCGVVGSCAHTAAPPSREPAPATPSKPASTPAK